MTTWCATLTRPKVGKVATKWRTWPNYFQIKINWFSFSQIVRFMKCTIASHTVSCETGNRTPCLHRSTRLATASTCSRTKLFTTQNTILLFLLIFSPKQNGLGNVRIRWVIEAKKMAKQRYAPKANELIKNPFDSKVKCLILIFGSSWLTEENPGSVEQVSCVLDINK